MGLGHFACGSLLARGLTKFSNLWPEISVIWGPLSAWGPRQSRGGIYATDYTCDMSHSKCQLLNSLQHFTMIHFQKIEINIQNEKVVINLLSKDVH